MHDPFWEDGIHHVFIPDWHRPSRCVNCGLRQYHERHSRMPPEEDDSRPMTGFIGTLTPDQKDKALAYDGPENHGARLVNELHDAAAAQQAAIGTKVHPRLAAAKRAANTGGAQEADDGRA